MYIVRHRLTGVGRLLLNLSSILAHKVDKLARGSLTVLYKPVFFNTLTEVKVKDYYNILFRLNRGGVYNLALAIAKPC